MKFIEMERSNTMPPCKLDACVDVKLYDGVVIEYRKAMFVNWCDVIGWRHSVVSGVDIDAVHKRKPAKTPNSSAEVSIDIEGGNFPLEVEFNYYPAQPSGPEDPGEGEVYEIEKLTLISIEDRIDLTPMIAVLDDAVIEKLRDLRDREIKL